jgi:hypothetical protein
VILTIGDHGEGYWILSMFGGWAAFWELPGNCGNHEARIDSDIHTARFATGNGEFDCSRLEV